MAASGLFKWDLVYNHVSANSDKISHIINLILRKQLLQNQRSVKLRHKRI